MACEYVRQFYGVPAEVGRRVMVHGNPGVIVEDMGNYIGVNFDIDRPGVAFPCHPEDGVIYLEMGAVRRSTRSQERYRRYLQSDCEMKFGEWLKEETKRRQANGS
jgi:hypothetical protein